MQHLLNILIWFPILGGLFVLRIHNDEHAQSARYVALFIVLVSLLLCIPLYQGFDFSTSGMQYVTELAWIPSFGMHYGIGIDGLSLLLIILSVFTNLIVILASWDSIHQRVGQYLASFLIMQGLLVGVFQQLIRFYFICFGKLP